MKKSWKGRCVWLGSTLAFTDAKPSTPEDQRPKMWLSRWNVSRGGWREEQTGILCPQCELLFPCFLDGPSFEELSCPSNWTWVEGSGKLFSCVVDGKPEPRVECLGSEGASEGVVLPLVSSNPGPRNSMTSSNLSPGIYLCNATNRHGSTVKTVVVSAECERAGGGGGRHTGGREVRGIPRSLPSLTPLILMVVLQRRHRWMSPAAQVIRLGWKELRLPR